MNELITCMYFNIVNLYFIIHSFNYMYKIIIFENIYINYFEFVGDVFGVLHGRPWEFNKDNPVRSIGLLYGIFGIPLYIAKWIFNLYNIPWTPFLLLFIFRLVTCGISFLTDYSLYKYD